MVATGGVLPTVVNVNKSHALQSVPSKARTCMVSEPELWPPRIHTLWRSAAATVMSVFAAQWALLGVKKYPLLASVPCPRTGTGSPHCRRRPSRKSNL